MALKDIGRHLDETYLAAGLEWTERDAGQLAQQAKCGAKGIEFYCVTLLQLFAKPLNVSAQHRPASAEIAL